jgi:hypothetical protein
MPLELTSLERIRRSKRYSSVKQAGGITFSQDESPARFYGIQAFPFWRC